MANDWDEILEAARRYGPQLDPVAKRYGLSGATLIAKTVKGESGGRKNAVSSAGARAWGQFMPQTRKAVLDATGGKVDPWRSPGEAVRALVMHQTGKLGHKEGLEGYNPGGGRGYVDYILKQDVGHVGRGGGSGGESPASGGSSGSVSVSGPSVEGSDQGSAGVAALLQAAMEPQQAPRSTVSLAAPAHSAAATTPEAYQQAPSGGGGPAPKSIDSLLQAVSAIPQSDTTVNPGKVTSDGRSAGDVVSSMGAPTGGSGRFKITGPNPGRIQPQVRNFVQRVAGVHGKTIVGSDGTGHSKHTTSGSVSEHYTGSATDIPAAGAELTRMGQAALVAAGWSPARARKAKGGIYNVVSGGKRHQIIFQTNRGGNHFDHLHVGVSGRK